MKTNSVKLLCTGALLLLLPALVCAQRKYALVIGNAAYTQVSRLRNTLNDAADVKAALEGMGFEAELLTDATLQQMTDGVDRFARRLGAARDSYGFFYYSGHGVQSQGENYLIPVNANIRREADLAYQALNVQQALDYLQEAGNHLNMVVLDACRDNPFGWARSGAKGLTVTGRQPPGSIVVYATSAGETASDVSESGTGRNGLFTGQLLKHLKTQGLDVNEIFRRTGADVRRVSNGRQIPAVYSQFFDTAVPWPGSTPQFGPIAAAVGNLEVAAVTAGTLNIQGGDLNRDVSFSVGGTLPISGLQTGTYRLKMSYRDGKTEEKTVEVGAGQTVKASFSYRMPPPVGNLEVAAVTAGTLNIQGDGLNRDVSVGGGRAAPINGLQTGTYRLKMSYPDGKAEEKTVEVGAGQTVTASFSYRIPPAVGNLQEYLSGYWNSNDVKIVCEDMVNQCLASPRIIQAIDAFGRVPRIIVDPFRNESSEHINTAELASLMEIALDQSGRFSTVAGVAVGAELDAEFRLSGTVSVNVDRAGNRTSRVYMVRVYLSDITTTERLWSGYNDSIRKTMRPPERPGQQHLLF
ncbi:MAG: caspase family protein [Treponema sp.]|jgi:hypothetical protein|nr:caspase family protein [Treponema sp.]